VQLRPSFHLTITPNPSTPVLGFNPFSLKDWSNIGRKTKNVAQDYVIDPVKTYAYDPLIEPAIEQVKLIPRRTRNLSDALLNLDRSVPNLWNDLKNEPLSLLEAIPFYDYSKDVAGNYMKIGSELAKSIWSWMVDKLVGIILGLIEWVIREIGFKALVVHGLELLNPLLIKLNTMIATATAGIGSAISVLASATTVGGVQWLKISFGSYVAEMGDEEANQFLKSKMKELGRWIKNRLTAGGGASEKQISDGDVQVVKSDMQKIENIGQAQINQIGYESKPEILQVERVKNQEIARKELAEKRELLQKTSGFDEPIYDLMIQAGFKNKEEAIAYFNYRQRVINNNIAIGLLSLVAIKQFA